MKNLLRPQNLGGGNFRLMKNLPQTFLISRRAVRHDVDIEKRPLAALDVAAKILAENFLRHSDVEQIVLNLKGHAEIFAELVEQTDLRLRRAGDKRPHLGANRKKAGRLSLDHVEILRHDDAVELLEIVIVDLPFTDFDNAVGENLANSLQIGRVRAQQTAIGERQQTVAGQQRDIGIPLAMNRGPAASRRVTIHDVVMNQSKIMHQFDGSSSWQCLFGVSVQSFAGEQNEYGPEPFAIALHRVTNGRI